MCLVFCAFTKSTGCLNMRIYPVQWYNCPYALSQSIMTSWSSGGVLVACWFKMPIMYHHSMPGLTSVASHILSTFLPWHFLFLFQISCLIKVINSHQNNCMCIWTKICMCKHHICKTTSLSSLFMLSHTEPLGGHRDKNIYIKATFWLIRSHKISVAYI